MSENSKDLYYVAVKLLLRNQDRLLITHDVFGSWDLPGGRMRKREFNNSLSSVVERKIHEEIGKDVVYTIGEPAVFFRVEREESDLDGQTVRIFAIGYEAEYKGGEIQLGRHHDRYEWVDVNDFRPEDYFVGGWLTGIREYLEKNRRIDPSDR